MTPDQLQQIIDHMTPGGWQHDGACVIGARVNPPEGDEGPLHAIFEQVNAIDEGDLDGVVALRNHATALVECVKLLKECREPCPISEYGLDDLRERVDAALKRLEEIK